jgi:16S rRNA (uracil1498-N3)-methyltransferase
MHRFHLPPERARSATISLTGAQAHHLAHVLRGKPGDRVTVFDGAGLEAICTVQRIEKSAVTLKVLQRASTPRLPYQITLAQAVPKARNMDWILQKATELGVQRIVPLLSARTVVHLEAEDVAGKLDRWQQITIEAAKQCGANWLPQIEAPLTPGEFFAAVQRGQFNLIASLQPDSLPLRRLLDDHREEHGARPSQATIVIGPEGDFTPAELADARRAGFRPLTLGPLVLRSETASLYALSILAYELQQSAE